MITGISRNDGRIAHVADDVVDHNVNLISSAPCLLEAIEKLCEWRELIESLPSFAGKGAMLDDFDQARDAITNATRPE